MSKLLVLSNFSALNLVFVTLDIEDVEDFLLESIVMLTNLMLKHLEWLLEKVYFYKCPIILFSQNSQYHFL